MARSKSKPRKPVYEPRGDNLGRLDSASLRRLQPLLDLTVGILKILHHLLLGLVCLFEFLLLGFGDHRSGARRFAEAATGGQNEKR